MKNLFILLFASISVTASAQTYIGLKAGANFTKVASPDFDTDLHTGFSGGLTFDQMVTSKLSISGELLFSQRGDISHLRFSTSPTSGTTTLKVTSIYNYLCVPVKASLWFGRNSTFFSSFGLVPGFLINAKGSTESGGGFNGGSGDISDQAKKFDLAAIIDAGLAYPLNDQYSFVAVAAFQYSLTSFNNISSVDSEFRHLGLTISAGIRMKLGGASK